MVYAGIMINGRTRLHVVANGTMTGQRYIDEVLLPHVRLFPVVLSVINWFLWTTTQHVIRTLAVQDCLDGEVAGRNYPPTNKNTLIRALTEEWDKLPHHSCWIMLCKVWYDVWNVASHSTVDISRTDTFL
ncbi:hypothetical protein TNCV_2198091 [Trichonephila clavipes]|nr:hypothetical protein TNCV_2198091 [Trichonephila clavipes]